MDIHNSFIEINNSIVNIHRIQIASKPSNHGYPSLVMDNHNPIMDSQKTMAIPNWILDIYNWRVDIHNSII